MTTQTNANLENSTAVAPALSDNSTSLITSAWVKSLLAGFSPSGGTVTLPGGLIIKWGLTASFDTGPVTTTFPVAFPTSCFVVMLTQNQDYSVVTRQWEVGSLTTSSFACRNDGNGQAFWLALGN